MVLKKHLIKKLFNDKVNKYIADQSMSAKCSRADEAFWLTLKDEHMFAKWRQKQRYH